jgi:hypothetical protein
MTVKERWLEDLANNITLRGEREIERLRHLKEPPRLKMVAILGEDWLERAIARAEEMKGSV